MKDLCARVPKKGSTAIARAYDCGIDEERSIKVYNGRTKENDYREGVGDSKSEVAGWRVAGQVRLRNECLERL
jgi:hypothetical protein